MTEATEANIPLVTDGPFYRLQQRLGLLGPDLLPSMRTALLSVAPGFVRNSAPGDQTFFSISVHMHGSSSPS